MANISLVRIDSRLIHGQVIVKWVKIALANKIIIIDDALAKDSFMADIYKMAAPKDIKVQVMSVSQAMENWEKDKFGEGNILLLMKDVDTCYRIFKLGFPLPDLQIGGLPSASGRTTIIGAISFNQKDANLLREMAETGVKITLQMIPEESKMDFEKAIKKFMGV